jgi:manganese/zinc/iron transport system permease protein
MDNIFWSIDIPAMMIAALSGLSCSLCGSLLYLKKQTMMADALSHSVLPGLAFAYVFTGSITSLGMLSGAFFACAVAAILIFLIKRIPVLNEGTALGVILTGFFALGVVMLESLVGSDVHLDTEHALYGALELVYWPNASDINTLPRQIPTLLIICILLILSLALLLPRLKIVLSDREMAKASGQPIKLIDATILVLTILSATASFEAVGLILVLALIACPPAAARLLTDNFTAYIALSGIFGVISALAGYYLGAILPLQIGMDFSLNAAGCIALASCMMIFGASIYRRINKRS